MAAHAIAAQPPPKDSSMLCSYYIYMYLSCSSSGSYLIELQHLLTMAALQRLKSPTVYALSLCIIIIFIFFFAEADQVNCSHHTMPAGMMARKLLLQQAFIGAGGSEPDRTVAGGGAEVSERGRGTAAVEVQMRMVPSGPDPLHHHRAVPKRPETP